MWRWCARLYQYQLLSVGQTEVWLSFKNLSVQRTMDKHITYKTFIALEKGCLRRVLTVHNIKMQLVVVMVLLLWADCVSAQRHFF